MFIKFFRKKIEEKPKLQKIGLICTNCCVKYYVDDLQLNQDTLLKSICFKCNNLVKSFDHYNFGYSGSDHYHSENNNFLIFVRCRPYPENGLFFELYSRPNNDSGWTFLGKTYDFIDAIKIANKIFI